MHLIPGLAALYVARGEMTCPQAFASLLQIEYTDGKEKKKSTYNIIILLVRCSVLLWRDQDDDNDKNDNTNINSKNEIFVILV